MYDFLIGSLFCFIAIVLVVVYNEVTDTAPPLPDDYELECIDDPDFVGVVCQAYCGPTGKQRPEVEEPR